MILTESLLSNEHVQCVENKLVFFLIERFER